MTKLRRGSRDIGIFGQKNVGKSTLLNALGYMRFKQGYMIMTNQESLNFPHTYISSLGDLREILKLDKNIPKIFLGDDFELWVNSRLYYKKQAIDINNIIIFFGKANCSLYYTGKRLMSIDIALRNSTDVFIELERLICPYIVKDPVLQDYLQSNYEYLLINGIMYDHNLEPVKDIFMGNLAKTFRLFDTQEYIKEVKT